MARRMGIVGLSGCGECDNCRALERVQRRVLAAVNPPFSHADQDVVDVWNDAVARYRCSKAD